MTNQTNYILEEIIDLQQVIIIQKAIIEELEKIK